MPVRAVVMERNEELKAQSAFVSTQRVLQLTILPEEKSFRCHQPQLRMAEEGPMPHCSPQLSPALSLKGAVIDTGWYHDTVLLFLASELGKMQIASPITTWWRHWVRHPTAVLRGQGPALLLGLLRLFLFASSSESLTSSEAGIRGWHRQEGCAI